MGAIKKSRSAYTGVVTRAMDKLRNIPCSESEEVASIDLSEVELTLTKLIKTETGFTQTLDDAQNFLPEEDEQEAFFTEEEIAEDNFITALAKVRTLGKRLIILKTVLNGLDDFNRQYTVVQDELTDSSGNLNSTIRQLRTQFSTLNTQWKTAGLEMDHPIRHELNSCVKLLTKLEASAAKPDGEPSSTAHATSGIERIYYPSRSELPTIDVPTFDGSIMGWSTFWASFKATIHDRTDLSSTQKLHYLRKAVKDPDVSLLLYSPTETPDMYEEVIKELQERYNKTREIHREVVKAILQLQPTKYNRLDLRRLADTTTRHINSLKAINHFTMESFLTSLLYTLLPFKAQQAWDQQVKKEKGVPPHSRMLKFISEQAESLAPTISSAHSNNKPSDSGKRPPKKLADQKESQPFRPKTNIHVAAPTPGTYRWDCDLCSNNEKHPLHICPKWNNFNITQRTQRMGHIEAKSLFSNCLAVGHKTNQCKSKGRCRECGQQHHTSIHQNNTPMNSSLSSKSVDGLMGTVQLLLRGPQGQEMKARALLDFGAGISLLSKKVAQQLGLPMNKQHREYTGVQETPCPSSHYCTTLTLSPLLDRSKQIICQPAIVQTVTTDLPPAPVMPVTDLPHLLGLQLADTEYHTPGRIDLLLGCEMTSQILASASPRIGKKGEPTAIATHFGWAISGEVEPLYPSRTPLHSCYSQSASEVSLEQLMPRFWDQEEPEQVPSPFSYNEQQVEDHYDQHTIYLPEEKRYEVTLPEKLDALSTLGNNRKQTVNRYYTNEKAVLRKGTWIPFQDVVKGYIHLRHAEIIPAEELDNPRQNYLPMHAVMKESSTSTKLRVVFDGSAITSGGFSFNNVLAVGPTLQPTLSNTLIRFRSYPVALNADISKMYREIKLCKPDKDLHRFVWRPTPEDPLRDYRMTRVTFGVSASPHLAVKTLQRTAKDHGLDYPEASKHILQSFYVDDFLGGAATVKDAIQLFEDLRHVLSQGGFNLCKWRSSSPEVMSAIPAELHETSTVKEETTTQTSSYSKALGLMWDSLQDVMSPSISVPTTYFTTKRGVYSDVAKTYDILGWISPTTLVMKILFQQLWTTNHDWDQEIPPDSKDLHHQWRNELHVLQAQTLSRCYSHPHLTPILQELHGFCNASQKGYGAVIYCRTTYRDHPPTVSLVTAKTKVARIKPLTIPRLELCGATLLTQLLVTTSQALNISMDNCHAWSDSSIVLSWLDGNESTPLQDLCCQQSQLCSREHIPKHLVTCSH